MNSISKGCSFAGAAASLVLSGSVGARADEKMGGDVFCSGINAAKARPRARRRPRVRGKNSCKEPAITKSTQADCQAKGGKVVPDPHPAK